MPTIAEIIQNLDQQTARLGLQGTWIPVQGVFALTSVTRNEPGNTSGVVYAAASGTNPRTDISFQVGTGLLVKVFINNTTGEIRMFPAKMFGYPDINIE
ncbi:MAG TPA: hypothetical protein VMU25_03995 [Candidatus Paceibacterota bacterium]|nr:hypothetical protein [Candidatus Paceibacterota bacterium]